MKTFAEYIQENGEGATTTTSGIDLDPAGDPSKYWSKRDKRKKWDTDRMYKLNNGTNRKMFRRKEVITDADENDSECEK